MGTQATIADFYKTSTTPGTPVTLGASTIKFNKLILSGYNAAQTANADNVKFRAVGATGWITVEPAVDVVVPIPEGSFLRASQIELDVTTSGDGLYVQYSASVVYEGP